MKLLADEPGFAQRNCFPWHEEKWDQDLLGFYQQLISLRKENDVLAAGSFQILYGMITCWFTNVFWVSSA
jgi:hypothetical protein